MTLYGGKFRHRPPSGRNRDCGSAAAGSLGLIMITCAAGERTWDDIPCIWSLWAARRSHMTHQRSHSQNGRFQTSRRGRRRTTSSKRRPNNRRAAVAAHRRGHPEYMDTCFQSHTKTISRWEQSKFHTRVGSKHHTHGQSDQFHQALKTRWVSFVS